jgi:hypothetical protein
MTKTATGTQRKIESSKKEEEQRVYCKKKQGLKIRSFHAFRIFSEATK